MFQHSCTPYNDQVIMATTYLKNYKDPLIMAFPSDNRSQNTPSINWHEPYMEVYDHKYENIYLRFMMKI